MVIREIVPLCSIVVLLSGELKAQAGTKTSPQAGSRITAHRIASLSAGREGFFPFLTVTRDHRRRYYVAPVADRSRIGVFDSSGRFQRYAGAAGNKSGEFMYAGIAWTAADSLFVLDGMLRRLTVLGPDFAPSRMVNLPVTANSAVMLPTALVVQGNLATRDAFGLPLHAIDNRGRLLRSFGAEPPNVRPGTSTLRRIAKASDNAVWTMPEYDYVLERWSLAGKREATVRLRREWFNSSGDSVFVPEDQKRPRPHVRAIQNRPDGTVWVITTVPKSTWKPDPRWASVPPGQERPLMPRVDLLKYVDTMVELLDPEKGAVIATARLPHALVGFASLDEVFEHVMLPTGEAIRVYRLTLSKQ